MKCVIRSRWALQWERVAVYACHIKCVLYAWCLRVICAQFMVGMCYWCCMQDFFNRSEQRSQGETTAMTTQRTTMRHEDDVGNSQCSFMHSCMSFIWHDEIIPELCEWCLMWLYVLIVMPYVVDIECFRFLIAWTMMAGWNDYANYSDVGQECWMFLLVAGQKCHHHDA